MADSIVSHQCCALTPNHVIQLAHVGKSRLLKIVVCVVTQNPLPAASVGELSKRNSVFYVDVTILRVSVISHSVSL